MLLNCWNKKSTTKFINISIEGCVINCSQQFILDDFLIVLNHLSYSLISSDIIRWFLWLNIGLWWKPDFRNMFSKFKLGVQIYSSKLHYTLYTLYNTLYYIINNVQIFLFSRKLFDLCLLKISQYLYINFTFKIYKNIFAKKSTMYIFCVFFQIIL